MKRYKLLTILLISLLLVGGCWDKREVEDNTFVVLLGIDKADDNDIVITVAFPLTQTEGGGANEGMDNGSGAYEVISVKALTMREALNMFSVKLSGPLALYSLKTIVISMELAQSDMLSHVFSSWNYGEVRNTTNVLISECKASDFIEARVKNSPVDPLRQEELLLEQANDSALYKPIQLLELLTHIKSDGAGGVAMYGGIAPKEDDTDEKVKEGYLPGEVPVKAENESLISGLAVFHGAKIVGVLDSSEAQTYALLTQSESRKILTLPDPLDPLNDIVVALMPDGKAKISGSVNGGIPYFTIDIRLKCTVESFQGGTDYTIARNFNILSGHVRQACSEQMRELIDKLQREYDADILRLGDKLAYNFLTAGEWERFNWPERYKEAHINLNVNVDIEHTGVMLP